MLRPLLLQQKSRSCLGYQLRSYAIMNRAKKQAGITDIIQPKGSTTNSSTPRPHNVVKYEKVQDHSLSHRNSYPTKKRTFNSLQEHRPSDSSKPSRQPANRSRYRHPLDTMPHDFEGALKSYDKWAPTPLKVVERSTATEGVNRWAYTTTATTPPPPPPPSASAPSPPPAKNRLYDRLARMSQDKAAGMNERLIKPIKEFTQPDNPHMIKVAVIGAPNAGKSTLVNKLIGEEVSIVSPKSHTTRERILAILSQDNYQVVFLDTPGIISPKAKENMNRSITTSSWRSLDEADHVLIMMDSKYITTKESQMVQDFMMERLSTLSIPATLLFNKMDVTGTDELASLQQIGDKIKSLYPHIRNELYISALEEDGIEDVKKILFDAAKPQPWIYPPEQTVEISDLKRVEELIRVQFFKRLHRYIPYMLKQENVAWTELPNGTLKIEQNVYVERDSQHKIVVGANGMVINRVVEEARADISKAFKRNIQLFIQVKTRKTLH
ncbi:hypothetical protein [Absidia glauca]|uniref:Era-type G domain-containing protein n=1 Tax=Absidia glauca TaxID=4829 RepID=A0A163J7U7_ABSGL|nr:hypothetical protein [Absidia glauca]